MRVAGVGSGPRAGVSLRKADADSRVVRPAEIRSMPEREFFPGTVGHE